MTTMDIASSRQDVRASSRTLRLELLGTLLSVVALAGAAHAQVPAPMQEPGCCCVAIKDGKIGCGEKSQAACLAEQPKTPLYDKLPDWAAAVAESKAQESMKMKTGWQAGKCPS
jgi:hypothetical protein